MRTTRLEIEKGTGVKLHYYPETDSFYVEVEAGPGAKTREMWDGLNVDLDADGQAASFDIDRASRRGADMIGNFGICRSPAARTRTERA